MSEVKEPSGFQFHCLDCHIAKWHSDKFCKKHGLKNRNVEEKKEIQHGN